MRRSCRSFFCVRCCSGNSTQQVFCKDDNNNINNNKNNNTTTFNHCYYNCNDVRNKRIMNYYKKKKNVGRIWLLQQYSTTTIMGFFGIILFLFVTTITTTTMIGCCIPVCDALLLQQQQEQQSSSLSSGTRLNRSRRTKSRRPIVQVILLAGEGNIEGYASIAHLRSLILDEYNNNKQQQQESTTTDTSSSSSSSTDEWTTTGTSEKESEQQQQQQQQYSYYVETDQLPQKMNFTIVENAYVVYEHYRSTTTTKNQDTLLHGPLTMNGLFGSTGGGSFGPEVPIGHTYRRRQQKQQKQQRNQKQKQQPPLVIIKVGWSDRSLYQDWVPYVGFQWYRCMNTIQRTANEMYHILNNNNTNYKHVQLQYLGLIWWQGYTDVTIAQNQDNEVYMQQQKKNKKKKQQEQDTLIGGFTPESMQNPILYNYSEHIVQFITEIRKTIHQPNLPVVIVELGYSGTNTGNINAGNNSSMAYELVLRQQQEFAVQQLALSSLSPTTTVTSYNNSSSNIRLVRTTDIVDHYLKQQPQSQQEMKLNLQDLTNPNNNIMLNNNNNNNNMDSYLIHPRNQSHYYYGRADVLIQISNRIISTIMDMNEQQELEEKEKQSWFSSFPNLFRHNHDSSSSSSSSSSSTIPSSEQQQLLVKEEENESDITRSIVSIVFLFVGLILVSISISRHLREQEELEEYEQQTYQNDNDKNEYESILQQQQGQHGLHNHHQRRISSSSKNKSSSYKHMISKLLFSYRPSLSTINENGEKHHYHDNDHSDGDDSDNDTDDHE